MNEKLLYKGYSIFLRDNGCAVRSPECEWLADNVSINLAVEVVNSHLIKITA